MRAVQLSDDLQLTLNDDITVQNPMPGECLLRLKASALNRRDLWMTQGKYPGIMSGVTLGSDGCGIVEKGEETWIGQEVIINPNVNWGNIPEYQSTDYSILGMPTNGTLAEYVTVPCHRLAKKPKHLSNEQAAALPLAGMTAYRACFTKGTLVSGNKVLITGAGGGVSQLALAFAVSVGCHVIVNSGSDEKIERSKKSGALEGYNYHDEAWTKKLLSDHGKVDLVIDSAGGTGINHYLKIVRPGGKIVIYGATNGTVPQFDLYRLFWSQISVKGSTMSNDQEFLDMVQFVSKHEIYPVIDEVYPVTSFQEAFDRFYAEDHFGKIVIGF